MAAAALRSLRPCIVAVAASAPCLALGICRINLACFAMRLGGCGLCSPPAQPCPLDGHRACGLRSAAILLEAISSDHDLAQNKRSLQG
jgi:hypothetical protein